jgi:hypothetical protein
MMPKFTKPFGNISIGVGPNGNSIALKQYQGEFVIDLDRDDGCEAVPKACPCPIVSLG